MKVAISIPDEVSARADRTARALGLTRSAIYREAMSRYLELLDENALTSAINDAVDAADATDDNFVRRAARDRLFAAEW